MLLFVLVDLYEFCQFEGIWVLVFVDRSVEQGCESRCEEWFEVFDDCWFDVVDVTRLVRVDASDHFSNLFFCSVLECEFWG